MNNPGEFYSLIPAGPYRGIPALFIVDTEEEVDEAELPKVVTRFGELIGFRPGKSFIYLSRNVDPLFVKTLRELGLYVVGESIIDENLLWMTEANHMMGGSKHPSFVGRNFDSFVYMPGIHEPIEEPEFLPAIQQIPKFLYVRDVNSEVLSFIKNSQYPWAIQKNEGFPFQVPIKL